MKKIITTFLLFVVVFSACNQAPPQNVSGPKETQQIIQTNDNYKMEAPLTESSIRGINVSSDKVSYIDYDNMEEELLNISKEYLNTNSYFYEPGQILDVEDAKVLLGRESDENPRGINPPKSKDINDSAFYINTIIEHDFYEYDEKGNKQLKAVAFGFGIDPKYQEGKKEAEISDEKIKDFITPFVSTSIKEYLEDVKDVKGIEIICGFYKESQDPIIPGSYYTYGNIPKDGSELDEVKTKNTTYKSYPNYELQDDKLNDEIIAFTSNISKYFTNYSGVSALGKFEDDKIVSMKINLVVNFYSKSEIEAFSMYVKENLSSDLINIPLLEINITLPSSEILSIIEYKNGKLNVDYIKN